MRSFIKIPYEQIVPTMGNIVVKLHELPEKIGALFIPDETKDNMRHQHLVGEIVSMGELAFMFHDGATARRQDVQKGDLVIFEPYAGMLADGDGSAATKGQQPYRIIPSKAVVAVIPQGATAFKPKRHDVKSAPEAEEGEY